MANKIPRVPVREQDPALRATNFEEVCYGYNLEEARTEASRCLHCRNPRCVAACPVGVQIPDFISRLCEGDVAGAADVIARDSSLPSICGRVCPQETQCEGACVLGIKGEPVAVGKLERFVGDWNIGHAAQCAAALPARNGRRVAVCRGAASCPVGWQACRAAAPDARFRDAASAERAAVRAVVGRRGGCGGGAGSVPLRGTAARALLLYRRTSGL